MTPPHVCVVLKRTALTKWVQDERDPRVIALLETGDETVRRMRPGHHEHAETVEEVRRALAELKVTASFFDQAPGFRVEPRCDLVVTVGGDGTLLAASHGVGPGVPLLGVNSAPSHSVGFFCAAKKGEVRQALGAALDGSLRRVELTRMRVERNGRTLHERVLNEALFCHASPAATSRYIVRLREVADPGRVLAEEEQKSSGVWVGPAAGSTAALRSAGGRVMPLTSRKLQYVVREPYPMNMHAPSVSGGLVDEMQSLELKSEMRDGRVFLDGDRIAFDVGLGDVVAMRRSDEPLVVLGLARSPKR